LEKCEKTESQNFVILQAANKFGVLTNFRKYSEQQAISFDAMEVNRSTAVPLEIFVGRPTLKEVRERCHANPAKTAKKLGLA